METLLFGGSEERLGRERLDALERAAAPLSVVVTDDPDTMWRHLATTVVAVRDVPLQLLREAPQLRWYQHWYAGVEEVVEALGQREVIVTNASGVHREPMAEQIIGLLLALARDIHGSVRNQLAKHWPPQSSHHVWEISGKSLLVVGYGAIGRRLAEVAGAFGMQVSAVRRDPEGNEAVPVFGIDRLGDALSSADVVVCVLPLTEETRGIFDDKRFAAMKPGAVFINAGRGAEVQQEALTSHLRSGHLSAAGLDVTDPEPLPSDSPLWEMENVIISPHIGGITPEYGRRVWEILLENLDRFHSGRQLRNVVDMEAGY